MTSRAETSIAKVRTDFGNFFVMVDHVGGRISGVTYKQPDKFADSRLDGFIAAIVEEIDACCADISKRWGGA